MHSQHSQPYTSALSKDARCNECGYCLWGLTNNVCPECGSTFNPDESSTFHIPRLPNQIRKFSQPPGAISNGLMVCFALLMVFAYSSPAWPPNLVGSMLVALTFAIVIIVPLWILKVLARSIAKKMLDPPPAQPLARWLCIPLMILLIGSVVVFPWPMYVRFDASLPDFENLVTAQSTTPSPLRKLVGLYRVEEIVEGPDECVFIDVGELTSRRVGFWKVPQSSRRPSGNHYVERQLTDVWYTGGIWY